MLLLLDTANVVPSSPILVTQMMEALTSSETSVLARATWRNIPEECILQVILLFGINTMFYIKTKSLQLLNLCVCFTCVFGCQANQIVRGTENKNKYASVQKKCTHVLQLNRKIKYFSSVYRIQRSMIHELSTEKHFINYIFS
jgi:hypothetical protein